MPEDKDFEDRGLAGVVERMMYGEAGPPQIVPLAKPRPTVIERAGTVTAVVFCAAIVFGLVMGCMALFLAVLG